ncbi:hypothetical protein H4R18_001639 [Coemansia javaensis]|uniref:Uncharacterized protein n=1 Tax=Coemansia javaensis TaxID=2761396 RepID=A0A9W8HJX8_9FUNG|nr:hypothetical protein H4R18_001639 [Coemansia javaensis]
MTKYTAGVNRAHEREIFRQHIGYIIPAFQDYLNEKGIEYFSRDGIQEIMRNLSYQSTDTLADGSSVDWYSYACHIEDMKKRTGSHTTISAAISDTDITLHSSWGNASFYASKPARHPDHGLARHPDHDLAHRLHTASTKIQYG